MDILELNNSNLNNKTVVTILDSYSVEFNIGIISAPLNMIEKGRFISDINISSLLIKGFRCLYKIFFLVFKLIKDDFLYL